MTTGPDDLPSPAPGSAPDDSLLDELSDVFGRGTPHDEDVADAGTDDPDDEDVADAATDDPDDEDVADAGTDDPDDRDDGPELEARKSLLDPGLEAAAGRLITGDEPPGDTSGAPQTIRIGDDDELPDATYLDDELASEGRSDSTVFIDDDETGDALVASEATAHTGIEPRIRQRRIGVRRAEGRRRLRWLVIVAAVVVGIVAVLAILGSSLFSIGDITVTGNRYTDPDSLNRVILDLDGTPVLLADTDAAEAELEDIPWVESARVRTAFPDSATIEIRERTPVAAMPGADGMTRVLDAEGRVLDLIDGQPIALVWISGPDTLDIPAGDFAAPGPTWAAALVPKLTPSIRPRVDSMQVTTDGSDLRLFLRAIDAPAADGAEATETAPSFGGPLIEVRFGSAIGDNEQIEKLVRLQRVLEDLDSGLVTSIDVSTEEVTVL